MLYLFLALLILSSNYLSANVIFPSWIMYGHLHQAYSIYGFVAVMLIAEFLTLLYFFPKQTRIRVALVTLVMNAASALVGLALHLGSDVGFAMLLWKYVGLVVENNEHVYALLYSLWFIIFGTIINTIVEFPIAWYLLGKTKGKSLLLCIAFANGISLLVGVGGAWLLNRQLLL